MSRRGLRITAALTSAFALTLGASAPAWAVADGTPAHEGQYRFAVKLTMTNIPRADGTTYNSGCSGALVAPQWILTAGHCFHDVARNPVSGPVPYDTKAAIGRVDDADTNGQVVAVESDFQAPGEDVALAKLASPVHGIRPLRISSSAPEVGDILRIAGWGSLGDTAPAPATHLQTGQVKVTTVSDTIVGVVGYAPEPTTSACLYDSGAPYFSQSKHGFPKLVAVESNGPSCPHDQVETTSRVDPLVPWLHETIDANS
jgi:secreted trypsin-like serine protease